MDSSKREMPACDVCQRPANQTCGGCKQVYYCSRAHQKQGWKDGHKTKCCPFKIQFTCALGRHMIATRDIRQGEIILKEKPAVVGPRMACKPHCLSCGKKLEPMTIEGKLDYYKCTKCYWPMCGPECEQSDIHKHECRIMKERGYKCNVKYDSAEKTEAAYCVIAPLRVLLMKDLDPKQFENIMNLESHLENRVQTQLYTVLKTNLVAFIKNVIRLPFEDDTILQVASIFDTNSFDVRSPDGLKRFRAIYVTASMMNHNCRPNTRHIFLGNDYNMVLIATVPIAKGELITATYTQSLWGTLDRRKHLKQSKCFDCECERCRDPTEFGTYIGNIYCSLCNGPFSNNGLNKGAMLISTNTFNETARWKCEKCDHYIQSRQMFWGNNALKQDLNKLNKTGPQELEDFIQKYNLTLHPTNHLIIQAKLALAQIYGNYKGYTLAELSDDMLKRKVELCRELLELADKLEPGWTRFRGTILLELQSAMSMQTKREFETQKLTKSGAQDQLMQSMALLQEATNILRIEPHMIEALEIKVKELSNQLDDANGIAE
ncbi:SET domain-containing protein SmydA-8 [Battus philenor]|uniref:SET domain-containing protein SmydA-8 n=1 Tax=Battus philenor TaxID=42288 RepID=UPI0035CFA4D2